MMSTKQAATTQAYRRARSLGYGVTDAVEQARSSAAYRKAAAETVRRATKRRA